MRYLILLLTALAIAGCDTVRLNSCVGPYIARTCATGQFESFPERQQTERSAEEPDENEEDEDAEEN